MNKFLLAVFSLALAGPAAAHTGHGETSGLVAGLQHPVFGPDHLLAMLAVGLWSGFVVPHRFWLGAATFMAAMGAGALISWAGVPIPMVETWIVLSVVALGLLTAVSRRAQPKALTLASLAAIGLFAACHGHAHATEAHGNALAYMAGFLISTAGLHLVGIGIARRIADGRAARLLQTLSGSGIAAAGLALMAGG